MTASGLVEIAHITKSFGNRQVLSDVTVSFPAGTVHGLLGANGSGKSTLIKVLAGYHLPDDDAARFRLAGKEHQFPLPSAERHAIGLAFVHQDLGLVPGASVAENLLIEQLSPAAHIPISWRAVHARAQAMLARVSGHHIDTRKSVDQLPAVDRAIVAIARAAYGLHPGGLLVLDEVTAFLPRDEVDRLFVLLEHLKAEGTSVLFVSHRLEEVRATCDTVTVLRGGEVAARRDLATTTDERIVADIVGIRVGDLYPQKQPARSTTGLTVTGLRAAGLGPVSFEAQAGEIIGLTGLRGMGYEQLVYALYGDCKASGSLVLDGAALELGDFQIKDAVAAGMALVPSDRLARGAVPSASVQENLTLPFLNSFFRGARIRSRDERAVTTELLKAYGVEPAIPDHTYSRLSGGNQQKVLMARWLHTKPKLLLLDEPTQGVDVGARRELFNRIVQAAAGGATVLYASTETQDLAELCHRVLVFRDGHVSTELAGQQVNDEELLRACWLGAAA
ncbi:MAG: ribose transport system ATP-binding protein [Frankiales bacterium]|nr:ribose transport system ATP-binding protein [Frankiales bacterium]